MSLPKKKKRIVKCDWEIGVIMIFQNYGTRRGMRLNYWRDFIQSFSALLTQ